MVNENPDVDICMYAFRQFNIQAKDLMMTQIVSLSLQK